MTNIDNVLLIVVDALRPDRVGAYGNSDLTPNIDQLANDGEVFESAYACINATDPSMTTILSGLYPTSHGLLNHQKHITDEELEHVSAITTLPQALGETHRTIGVDILERWHERGFDQYLSDDIEGSPLRDTGVEILEELPEFIERGIRRVYRSLSSDSSTPYMTAMDATDHLLDALRETDSPWFSLVHYWDTHLPYVPLSELPESVRGRPYPGGDESLANATEQIEGSPWRENLLSLSGDAKTVGDMMRKYDGGVVRVDKSLGRIRQFLRDQDEYENTAIILTADHGESLGENGVFFDHHTLYEPNVHVPLVIDAPGFDGRSDAFVQHFDLVPTILDILGMDTDLEQFDGQSIVPGSRGRNLERDTVFHEEAHTARRRAIRTEEHRYIKRLDDGTPCRYCGYNHAEDNELYDVQTHTEMSPSGDLALSLDRQLEQWIAERPDPRASRVDFGNGKDIERRLKEMGYL